MRRMILAFLCVILLFTGCQWEPGQSAQPTDTSETTQTTEPQPKPSIYDPSNPIEEETGGAVTAYRLEADHCDIAFMGEDLLLMYNDGFGPTRVLVIENDGTVTGVSAELNGQVYREHIRVSDSGLAYYSELESSVVILDKLLREVYRCKVPGEMEGIPLIREDMTEAYYTVGSDIRALNLETGISRILRQRNCNELVLQKSMFGDSILLCSVTDQNGTRSEFFSAETGENLGADPELLSIAFYGKYYYLERMEGIVRQRLFSIDAEPLQSFIPREDAGVLVPVPEGKAVADIQQKESACHLGLYDMACGKMTAEVSLKGLMELEQLTADPTGRYLWFQAKITNGDTVLYCWDTQMSLKESTAIYTGPRFTEEAPDEASLAQLRIRADMLKEQYGVEIFLEPVGTLPEDYTAVTEYQVQAITLALEQLEAELARYPENYFWKLGRLTRTGRISLGLVRSIHGRTYSAVSQPEQIQYWSGGKACVGLEISEDMAFAIHSGIARIMDTLVLNESLAFDDWENWTPGDFSYDGNYTAYLTREDTAYLEGEQRAFVTSFGMTFATEDRAEIFAAAMAEGNEALFAAPAMQDKLYQVCKGIRDAFGWRRNPDTFPWEQYLAESLAYKN